MLGGGGVYLIIYVEASSTPMTLNRKGFSQIVLSNIRGRGAGTPSNFQYPGSAHEQKLDPISSKVW